MGDRKLSPISSINFMGELSMKEKKLEVKAVAEPKAEKVKPEPKVEFYVSEPAPLLEDN